MKDVHLHTATEIISVSCWVAGQSDVSICTQFTRMCKT